MQDIPQDEYGRESIQEAGMQDITQVIPGLRDTDFESHFFETPETTRRAANWEDCTTKKRYHDEKMPEETQQLRRNGSPAPLRT